MPATYTSSIVITGGTQGVGYHCALSVAKQCPNALIIIASRTDRNSAAATINKTLSQTNVKYLFLDLSSLVAVRTFAQNWKSSNYPAIQALVLNAGLQFPGDVQYSVDGIEKTFAINHVGHALLFHLLAPFLAPDARIVVTSSGTHDPAQKTPLPDAKFTSGEELAHPSDESKMQNEGRQRYATSKLCNVLWTYSLASRFEASTPKSGRAAMAFDPGLMPGTGLAREYSPVLRFIWLKIMPRIIPLLRVVVRTKNVHSAEESGQNLAWVAVGEGGKGKNGVYFEGRKEIKSSKESYVKEKQEALWGWTVGFLGESEEEQKAFEKVV
ncbi:NAD(P)-binding protein [Lindgomyces ingoldianus]|uniref:NAD(P)-binding protein n=1 Tax=Lindgomyces ingoldianus TaxID=673940 RepID=A0ACB6QTY0_9PLEO|nr:NAD(P)-binding protein [Lindgomyces ingoldianus]KAF2470443.1 NAD(P)-binding protein [Lindgomyces ingoldianus]